MGHKEAGPVLEPRHMVLGPSTTRTKVPWSCVAQGAGEPWEERKLTVGGEMGPIMGGFLEEAASELGV